MRLSRIAVWSLLTVLGAPGLSGCNPLDMYVEPYVDDDPGPLGATIQPHLTSMIEGADASDFVVVQHEWVGTTAQLTQNGKDHLVEVARRLLDNPFPVLIEPVALRFDERNFDRYRFADLSRERREAMEIEGAARQEKAADYRARINSARRREVVRFLTEQNYPYAEQCVFVAYPYSPGISGMEGVRNYTQMLSQQNFGPGDEIGRRFRWGGQYEFAR